MRPEAPAGTALHLASDGPAPRGKEDGARAPRSRHTLAYTAFYEATADEFPYKGGEYCLEYVKRLPQIRDQDTGRLHRARAEAANFLTYMIRISSNTRYGFWAASHGTRRSSELRQIYGALAGDARPGAACG